MKMGPGSATGVTDRANDRIGLDMLTDNDVHFSQMGEEGLPVITPIDHHPQAVALVCSAAGATAIRTGEGYDTG